MSRGARLLGDAAERYVSFCLAHMATEELHVLPLAEQVLTDNDWAELDQAFGADCDLLAGQGHVPEADCRALFTHIVNLWTVLIGLGSTGR